MPLAVILVVPMCLLFPVTGIQMAHNDVNIFTQIGFVLVMAGLAKNAILIVEFAKCKRATAGMPRAAKRFIDAQCGCDCGRF